MAWAVSFAFGALAPVLLAAGVPQGYVARAVTVSSIILLAVLGAVAAKVGGASTMRGALRVVFWGSLAMGVSTLVGRLFGARL